jgi:hypothetical protein
VKKNIAAGFLLLTLAACSNFLQPTPTPSPTQTPTAIPTLTATVPPTETSGPPTATENVVATLAPEGEPASEWNGIPIMPGVITGEGDEEGYVFTITATSQQIQEYYELELGKLGWQSLAEGDGSSSSILIFTNEASETLSVSIITKGDDALVLLVK